MCYALGCICVGYYLTLWRTGRDIRTLASGNVGARNVGRILGKSGFVITLAGDFSKGALALGMARSMELSPLVLMAAMLAVLIGHIWPVQLDFRGGKGVAVTLGMFAFFDLRLLIGLVVVFVLAWLVLRRYIISGIVALAALPVVALAFKLGLVETTGIVLITVLILVAHRSNIQGIRQRNRTQTDSADE
jgi:acyl phosphate:glycerol-3-phosphate acyltransferase